MSNDSYIDPHIIFSSRRWWNYDIFITDIYGNNITHLTKNKWLDFNPAISANGKKVAFISNRDGNREIYTVDLIWMDGYTQWKGENLTNLTKSEENEWTPRFSPLNDKIVFTSYFALNDNYDIFIMDIDGSNKKNITNTSWYEKYPQFSPDGSFIIYQAWQKGKMEIFIINILEENKINLTRGPNSHDIISHGNSISPDGQKIVFTSERNGNRDIYIMNSNGTNQIQLTTNLANDYEPIFSSEGSLILFTTERDGNKEIYSMTSEGKNKKNLSKNIEDDWNPRFYPDNKKVVFQSLRNGPKNWEIYIMNIDGNNQMNVSNYSGTDYSYVILPLINP
jgi:Tol biopolymer transport system component